MVAKVVTKPSIDLRITVAWQHHTALPPELQTAGWSSGLRPCQGHVLSLQAALSMLTCRLHVAGQLGWTQGPGAAAEGGLQLLGRPADRVQKEEQKCENNGAAKHGHSVDMHGLWCAWALGSPYIQC
eukprot:365530-Chlamydomonas_euryale.AAC.10